MKNVALGFLAGLVGYVLLALLSYYLISKFSSNGHDRGMEASMTSIFVFGPIGFIVGCIGGYLLARKML